MNFSNSFENRVLKMIDERFSKDFQIEKEVKTGFYTVDVYFPERNLLIAINGQSHYYNDTNHLKAKETLRTLLFEKSGLQNITLTIDCQECIDKVAKKDKGEMIINKIEAALQESEERLRMNNGLPTIVPYDHFFNILTQDTSNQ